MTFNVLLPDSACFYQSVALTLPSNVALLFQPLYNPCKRVRLAVKDHCARRCFDALLASRDPLAEFIEYAPTAFQSLIASPCLTHAIPAPVALPIGIMRASRDEMQSLVPPHCL